MNESIYNSLYAQIEKMAVIDTHEHFVYYEQDWLAQKNDVLSCYLSHYLSSDLVSAGVSPEDMQKMADPSGNLMDRWRIVEPYWDFCRHTGYGRAIGIAAKRIYGIDRIDGTTIEQLNAAFIAANAPGHYQHVLKDICNIELCLNDSWDVPEHGKNPPLQFVWQPLNYAMRSDQGAPAASLDEWVGMLESEMDRVLNLHGTRVIKCPIAYWRSLRFDKVEYKEAKKLFDAAIKAPKGEPIAFPIPLQDYLMHEVLRMAGARNLTFQFHTGLLEGNGNTLTNSDPALLTNLFLAYPDVDFDLFHIGYPYQGVVCALAKMFPNVTIDMCWAHIISPAASVAALGDFLDAVPYNKISAFGGDYLFVDGAVGHLQIAKENVARALMGKVELGVFDEGRAIEIAKALFYENPKRICKLA